MTKYIFCTPAKTCSCKIPSLELQTRCWLIALNEKNSHNWRWLTVAEAAVATVSLFITTSSHAQLGVRDLLHIQPKWLRRIAFVTCLKTEGCTTSVRLGRRPVDCDVSIPMCITCCFTLDFRRDGCYSLDLADLGNIKRVLKHQTKREESIISNGAFFGREGIELV